MRRGFPVAWGMILGGLSFILVGGLFASIGGWHLWHTARALSEGERVIGTVVEVQADDDTYRPVFTYVTANGAAHRSETLLSASNYGYSVGAQMPVYTAPGGGGPVRVGGFLNLWLFGAGFFVLGAPFVPAGIWIIWKFGRLPWRW